MTQLPDFAIIRAIIAALIIDIAKRYYLAQHIANLPPTKSIPESITRLTAWEGFPKRLSIPKLKCQ